jgi:hypothetical protein
VSRRVQQLALWLAAEEVSILSSLALQTAKRISQTMELQALHRCSQNRGHAVESMCRCCSTRRWALCDTHIWTWQPTSGDVDRSKITSRGHLRIIALVEKPH